MFPRSLIAFALVFLSLAQYGLVSARPEFPQFGKRVTARSLNSPEPHTNAARMAMGLPPMQPRSLHPPTPIEARHGGGSQPSSVPRFGKIEVRKETRHGTSKVGYLKNEFQFGRFEISDHNNLLNVVLPTSGNGPFNLQITNPGSPFPYVGIAGGSLSNSASSSLNYVVGTKGTPAGSIPWNVGNSASFTGRPNSESMIWYFNSANRELTARWRNSNGVYVDVNFFYIESGSSEGVYASGRNNLPGYDAARLFLN